VLGDSFNISTVFLESGLTTTGNYTFSRNLNLRTISLPNTITTVSDNAFEYSGLNYINIPSSVTAIRAYAFQYCRSLKYITLNRWTSPSTITTLGTGAFTNANASLRIYVPVGSSTVYKNATNWSTYANQIYEDTPENRALFGD
jgi:hypothetical protein